METAAIESLNTDFRVDTQGIGEVVHIGYVGGEGGDAAQTLELAAGQASAGLPVMLIVPQMPRMAEMAKPYHNRPNLRLIETPLIRFDTPAQNPLDVARLLQQFPADLYHLHTGDIAIPRMTLLALELVRRPKVIATIHAAYPDMPFGSSRAQYWASVVRRRLNFVVTPSKHGRETQVQYGVPPEKARAIYNGIDTTRFTTGDGKAARRQLGVGSATPLIVQTARLHPQKRPLDAVEAFARIAEEFPVARLVYVGTGPLMEETVARTEALGLSDRVHFMGHQFNIPDWLAAADIWLTTSDAENFSISVIEAMAAGNAVVGTFCRGNDEIFVDGENALTAPVGDTAGLADRMRRLLLDTDLRHRVAGNARRTAACYSREAMVAQYLDLYREAQKA
ncbi:MAG: hypothetical protein OHK0029_23390 [Armatimonadaceae bacterium]